MRYYPLDKDPAFYIEQINEWGKYETCHDLANTIKRRKNNICGTHICPIFYHPEKEKTSKIKKPKKKKKKKNETLVRQKDYDEPEQKIIRYWNDIDGKKIDPIKNEHLNWPDWSKTRLRNVYLPCDIRPTYIKILQGQPPPLPYALEPINLAEVINKQKEEKIAAKLAKKLAKEAKKEASLEKSAAQKKKK